MTIELLQHSDIKPFVREWGIQPKVSMQEAKDFSCPYCGNFGFFCGLGTQNNAARWRSFVVGFRPRNNSITYAVGELVFRCRSCGKHFRLLLPLDHLIEGYADGCLFWPKPNYSRFVNTVLCHEAFEEVADAFALVRHKWQCATLAWNDLWRQAPR